MSSDRGETATALIGLRWMWHSSAKASKKGGSARASPVAAPMPKSVSFSEKRETA